jgi:hypothetical protein
MVSRVLLLQKPYVKRRTTRLVSGLKRGFPVLHSPGRQRGFSPYQIILEPVDGLPSEPRDSGDLADACRFCISWNSIWQTMPG